MCPWRKCYDGELARVLLCIGRAFYKTNRSCVFLYKGMRHGVPCRFFVPDRQAACSVAINYEADI